MNFFIVYNNVVVVVAAAIIFITLFGLSNGEKPEHSIPKECATQRMECGEAREQPVCGTDGKTYPSRCHLLVIQCTGHQVSVKHMGSCKECQQARRHALNNKNRSSDPQFIPNCRSDGTYSPVQCVWKYGCWCSDSDGKPIPNTAIKNERPNCRKFMNVQMECSKTDQNQFIAIVMQRFNDDYKGYNVVYHTSKSHVNKEQILNWNFWKYDINENNILDKFELRRLKHFLKKTAKPKQCARTLAKLCDTNNDEKLSWKEWKLCFPPETGNGFHELTNVNSNSGSGSNNPQQPTEYEYEELEYADDYFKENNVSPEIPNCYGPLPVTEPVTEPSYKDCFEERNAILDEKQGSNATFYIPACTSDGRYEKVQCYPKTSYCWCVDEDNGNFLKDTQGNPRECKANDTPRPFPGCPENIKSKFLRDLKLYFANIISLENYNSNGTTFKSEDEKIGMLSFVHIDKNKNRHWEKKEWKEFRDLVGKSKLLRKCGRRLPRYCDANKDKKITLEEWLKCIQSENENNFNVSNSTLTPKSEKLTGTNPIESILN